jgi:hypothetical protein
VYFRKGPLKSDRIVETWRRKCISTSAPDKGVEPPPLSTAEGGYAVIPDAGVSGDTRLGCLA